MVEGDLAHDDAMEVGERRYGHGPWRPLQIGGKPIMVPVRLL